MKKDIGMLLPAFALAVGFVSVQANAKPCTDNQLARAARAVIVSSEARYFEGPAPKTWEIETASKKIAKSGEHEKYTFLMTSDTGYSVPVYVYTPQDSCDVRSGSVFVDWKNGDDG